MAVMLLTVMFFAQRGARQGAYTSITFLAALAVAALITLNYTAGLTVYLARFWSGSEGARQAAAMTILFGVFGGLFCYPILRYFSATMPLPEILDRAMGVGFGILLGILLLGMIGGIWFKTPLAQSGRMRVNTADLKPKRPDWFVAAAFEHVVDHSPHRRPFDAGRFLKATYGSQLPPIRSGFWVSSSPRTGLRVFTTTRETSQPRLFRNQLIELLSKNDADLKRKAKAAIVFHGRTPVKFGFTDAWGQNIRKILVAVEITVPDDLSRGLSKNATPYVKDGESLVFWEKVGDEIRLVKCYNIDRGLGENFVPLITLFTPQGASLDDLDELLPVRPAFKTDFDEDRLRSMLEKEGAREAEIDRLVNVFSRAGKIVFHGSRGINTIQVSGIGDPLLLRVTSE